MNKNMLFTLLFTVMSCIAFQPTAAAATTFELVPSSRVILQIIPGMTIDEIIAKIYPQHQHLWPQIKAKLIAWNPNSFQQYSDTLVNGARLKLVDVKTIYEEELAPKRKVGYVAQMNGAASVKDLNGKDQQLQVNSQVYEGDRIRTETGSTLYVLMDDGAEVHLKEDSVIKISQYVITSGYDEGSSSILDLLRGGFRKITGSIGASALSNYQVQTGLATIGIRGTEYVVKLCKLDDCTQTVSRNDPDAKLHAVVLKGSITLTTESEVQILMALGEYGTATPEVLTLEQDVPVPVGFLNTEEAYKFNVTIPQQKKPESSGAKTWMWFLGAVLLAVGL